MVLVLWCVAAAMLVPATAGLAAAQQAPSMDADTEGATSSESLDPTTPVVSAADAAARAKATGGPVVVRESLTETTAAVVWPDGSQSEELFGGTVRVRGTESASGWVPLDLDLVDGKDGFHAKAGSRDVVLSAGGLNGVLARVPVGASVVELLWDGPLAAPTISGATATYPDVQPGVDLAVTMRAEGVKVGFVVRAKPRVALSLPIRVRATGLTIVAPEGEGGRLEFVDETGEVVGSSDAPTMFDESGDDPKTGDPINRAPVESTLKNGVDGVTQTLTPDPAFFERPALKYPVTIDPSPVDVFATRDLFVASADPATAQTGALKVGTNLSGNINRILIRFSEPGDSGSIGEPVGKIIDSATLSLYLYEIAGACEPTRTFRVYRSLSLFSEGQFWNSWSGNSPAGLPTHDGTFFASNTVTCSLNLYKGISGSGTGTGDHANLGRMVQHWANAEANQGLIVRTTTESLQDTRRHFKDREAGAATQPKLNVSFHAGAAPTISSSTHPVGTPVLNSYFTGTYTPVNAPGFTDWIAGDPVKGVAQWQLAVNGSPVGYFAPGPSLAITYPYVGFLAPGNTVFQVRAQRNDGYWSPWSAGYVAQVADAAVVPVISSSTHVSGQWKESLGSPQFQATWSGPNYMTGTGASGYGLVFDQNPSTVVASTPDATLVAPGAPSFSLDPAPGGASYLHVAAKDYFGSWGSTQTFALLNINGSGISTDGFGPGSVDLVSGDFSLAATDVSIAAPGGSLTIARSYHSRTTASGGAASSVLGPGWLLDVSDEDATSQYARLVPPSSTGVVVVASTDGEALTFRRSSSPPSTYVAPGSDWSNLEVTEVGAPATEYLVTDVLSGDVVRFTLQNGVWVPLSIQSLTQTAAVRRSGVAPTTGLVDRMATWPKSMAYTATQCLADAPPAGCIQLRLNYVTLGTAQRLSTVEYWALPTPGGTFAKIADVASYSYEGAAPYRLVTAADPRTPSNSETYTYYSTTETQGTTDAAPTGSILPGPDRLLKTYKPDGGATTPAYTFAYANFKNSNSPIAGIDGDGTMLDGRIVTSTRNAFENGSPTGTPTRETAVWGVPYDAAGPWNLSAAQTALCGNDNLHWPHLDSLKWPHLAGC